MCLAIPMKITHILPDDTALVESDGVTMEISLKLLDSVSIGDYVTVHTGFALDILDPVEAKKTLRLFDEIVAAGRTDSMPGE